MANLSEFAANALLDGNPMPTTLWLQLHVADPGAAGTANIADETRRMSFIRTAASAGACSNDGAMLWDNIPSNETISHVTIWDDDDTGNPWWIGPATVPLVVTATNNILIPVGDLDLALTVWT